MRGRKSRGASGFAVAHAGPWDDGEAGWSLGAGEEAECMAILS